MSYKASLKTADYSHYSNIDNRHNITVVFKINYMIEAFHYFQKDCRMDKTRGLTINI